ncbi:hypothetical protein CRD60_00440 [Bifidobacterium aemilianum]|uniref:DUF3043 domain-containing protein n=1 Tax=Bifidobacterium aemilianum TaxID=2493120 RepID=A0A366K9V9_9BIFI|nr:DUF3043 domain-containing protein [Bifidobacterium aemilianum]RBP98379.1 hypothetical protein CRD60_00440 [Bifidobacterium aemilianum]
MTWNPFKKQSDEEQAPIESGQQAPMEGMGKGRPTPKRKQAQEQKLRPLVPKDRKASAKAAKARIRAREDAQYEAMRTGDTAHMPKAERLPWRVYIRDYVDARFNLGEFFVPVFIVVFVLVIVLSAFNYQSLSMPLMAALYLYVIIAVIDLFLMWRKLKKQLIAKFGERSVAKGSRSASYACNRAIQLRRWRLPKPRSKKRGQWPQ